MKNNKHQYYQQSGVALVTAILIVALASILAASLLKRLNLDISRTQNIIQNEQAYLYALGSEIIALAALTQDAKDNKHDSLDEYWALKPPANPVEGGQVSGYLQDLQGRFNLNNLSKAINSKFQQKDLQRFQRLLVELKLNKNLANAIVDWIDKDLESSIPGGAEDDYYMGLEKPYRAGNTLLNSPSELRQIKGFEKDKIYNILLPHIITLPVATSINVNTASREVLKSLNAELKDEDVDKILDRLATEGEELSESEPFEDISDFESFMRQNTSSKNFKAENMLVNTRYFLLTSTAEIARGRVTLYSIIYRDGDNAISVISRSQGAW
jgi:general secretion pathway protein K